MAKPPAQQDPRSGPGLCPGGTLQTVRSPRGRGCPALRRAPYLVGKIVRHHLDPRFNCSSTQVLGEHPWQGTWSWGALGSPERAAVNGGGCPGQPGPAGPPGAAWSMPPGSLRALRRRCWARSYLRGGGGGGGPWRRGCPHASYPHAVSSRAFRTATTLPRWAPASFSRPMTITSPPRLRGQTRRGSAGCGARCTPTRSGQQ